ncbi:hypothetical protein SERLADRAFT_458057 [Serpula lacrymans var. lacrymans S7.9]|uniref:Uncharacterized protein n=1 Tax=Serpula lacrymans var. lacrymans (strain S7.9) TaxID=578457 RepID=F8NIM9_SERL9|nr:uncharacterized protein SERLADRAFT_458057 [Serpula lacrymans var. lacrymans S7.9]EGO29791.1 hypothetical protein SERLADRAFT_458057 [Serpula lacrymans var. lacrymans S7.9]
MFISDDLEHGDQKAHYSIPRKPELVVLPPENSSSSEQRVLPWEINSPLHRQPSHHSIHTSPSQ